MSLPMADCLEAFATWWDHHGTAIIVTCLFGLAISDRFLAGLRGRAAIDPENNDYADPTNDLDP
jgi:hypothetical protein